MQLYVVRHGIAEDAVPGQDDASRVLTQDGKQKLKRVVKGLRALDIELGRILTSPWERARQTAKLLAKLSATDPFETALLTQSPKAELLGLLAESVEATAVVGHEPWLSELVGWLAFGDTRHGQQVDLKKAGVIWLDGNVIPGGMKLRALLPPSITRRAR